jgi:hypothetical protein
MTLKITTLLLFTFVAATSFAHVEPGTWKGKTTEGKECAMVADKTYFEGGTRHPLNERIKIAVDGAEFIVGHPASVDLEKNAIQFNHEAFQSIVPMASGARALIIEMMHSETHEGPAAFTLVENKWGTAEKTSLKCLELKHEH